MQKQKPKMFDPEEMEIIRQIYFPKKSEDIDVQEWRSRQYSRINNLNNSSR